MLRTDPLDLYSSTSMTGRKDVRPPSGDLHEFRRA